MGELICLLVVTFVPDGLSGEAGTDGLEAPLVPAVGVFDVSLVLC